MASIVARTKGPVRIGIIGCGAIAEGAHLPAVLSSPQVELAAISDLNASRLQYLRRRYRLGPIAFQDYREVVGRVDAVILALPNHLHAPVGVELLSRGIHVLCEKPLAVTRHECEQLTQAARSAASILAVGFVARFSGSYSRLTTSSAHRGGGRPSPATTWRGPRAAAGSWS